ncbi:MAG: ribosomal protein S18-alanine N-acetyltransferase [Thermoplasmatales archaeon]|nr:MAG: ribosomal protein S18-alanine N-acetyltransferase [Thermoplasmatales archaeon]
MFEIRQVQPIDIFPVIKIAYESLPERYSPMIFNKFYESFSEGFLVAEKAKKIVGFIIGIKTSNETVRIPMLAVHKNYRRQGVGSALITQMLKKLRLQNIQHIDLEVKTSNTAAIQFYKKHGFVITENIPSFYQTGEDAYIMKRELQPS